MGLKPIPSVGVAVGLLSIAVLVNSSGQGVDLTLPKQTETFDMHSVETCQNPGQHEFLVGDSGLYSYPGLIEIEHRGLDVADTLEPLLKGYGLSCSLSVARDIKTNSVVSRKHLCSVRKGHECVWLRVLTESPLVQRVKLKPITWAAVFSQTTPARMLPEYLGPAPSGQTVVQRPGIDLLELTHGFLKRRYQKATVSRGLGSVAVQQFVVRDLRGEVIKKPVAWERLEINTIITQTNAIVLVVDGYYSAGLGAAPPADEAYEHMERKYYREIAQYVGGLTRDLETELTRKP